MGIGNFIKTSLDRAARYVVKAGASEFIRERVPVPEIALVQGKAVDAVVEQVAAQLQNEVVAEARDRITASIWERIKSDLGQFVNDTGARKLLEKEVLRLVETDANARFDRAIEAVRQ